MPSAYESTPVSQPDPYKVTVFTCPDRGSLVFRVISQHGNISDFQFDSRTQKMIRPVRIVREKDLFPKYFVDDERAQTHIMFAFNRVTNEHEQYVFCWETKQLEQIHQPEHFYRHEHTAMQFRMRFAYRNGETVDIVRASDGSVEKISSKNGKLRSGTVKTLVDYDDHDRYIRPLPKYKIRYCRHSEKSVIYARYMNGFRKFVFNEDTKQLEELKCDGCSEVTEDDLYPQYFTHSDSVNSSVILAWNTVTERIEQYIFNVILRRFEQVQVYDVVYNPEKKKHRIGGIMFAQKGYGGLEVATMICEEGTLKRGEFSEKHQMFVPIQETSVKTFLRVKNNKTTSEVSWKASDLDASDRDEYSSGFEDDDTIVDNYSTPADDDERLLEENYCAMEFAIEKLLF
ncbi:hypothetical protein GCK72_010970 [Caenorhabditis remanei]|uniref:Uncharacterized protein n=1 Tax=Caenorhabditis remanei TaxID=31234 RepID=A0A6A5H4S0_CAERE|nr:hypothetical protein GCK72_010970 [Caenorhabditis remanei]KAF1762708.1 hypothetical protein GCK72_010970 [Caenorhabditis remanei]